MELQKKHEQKQQQQKNGMIYHNNSHEDDAYDEDCHLFACTLGNFFLENSMKSVGIDTVGHCLALVVHFMVHRPLVQHQLREELTANVVGDEVKLLPKLVKAVIKETLRLCLIVSFASSRRCTPTPSSPCGVQLNSKIVLNVGDSVEVDVFTMGRNRAVWGEDADQFRPERWLNGSLPADWKFHWLPFGGLVGPRHCVGLPLANQVMEMAISQLFRRFTSPRQLTLRQRKFVWSVRTFCGRRKC